MKKVKTNYELIDLITPVGGMTFDRNKIYLGDRFCKIYLELKQKEERKKW